MLNVRFEFISNCLFSVDSIRRRFSSRVEREGAFISTGNRQDGNNQKKSKKSGGDSVQK